MKNLSLIGLVSGILLFFLLIIFPVDSTNVIASRTAAVAVLMAVWWMTEALPLAVTSLVPLIIFPLTGILNYSKVSSAYVNNIIFLFLGGFFIAIAIEKWNLHKRISLMILNVIGGSLSGILFATMFATSFLSMFINNTSAAMMMLPIGMSLVLELEEVYKDRNVKSFGVAMMLGVAYSASIGGIATLVGTAPNLVFVRIFQIAFPKGPEISFTKWMIIGLPTSLAMLGSVWYLLRYIYLRKILDLKIEHSFIKEQLKNLGKSSYEERILIGMLFVLCFLWVFRVDLNLEFLKIYGWSNLLPFGNMIDDSTVAIFMAFLLFLIPTKNKSGKILNGDSFSSIPWDVIILFGGGFALADAFQSSGLSIVLSKAFTSLAWLPPIVVVALVCTLLTFLTELTSNTATTQTVLPIFVSASVAMHINPLFLMIPATISASFAFMLPVGTPPNAIVFGTGRVNIKQMAKTGFIINIIGIVIVTLIFYYLGTWVFGVDATSFPDWGLKK